VKWTVPCSGGNFKDVNEYTSTHVKQNGPSLSSTYGVTNEARTSAVEDRLRRGLAKPCRVKLEETKSGEPCSEKKPKIIYG